MPGFLAKRNHKNCLNLRNLRKSEWHQELGKILKSSWKSSMPSLEHIYPMDSCRDRHLLQHQSHSRRRTADCGCVWNTEMLHWTSGMPLTWSESMKTTSTKPNFASATTPIRGDESSAEQRPLKRGMTLPEPKSRYNDPTGGAGMRDQSALNDREVQRHPESRDKCTRTINIHTKHPEDDKPT